MTNETIKAAVKEFAAESAEFNSPQAEAKWGRIADWDVSEVSSMYELFEDHRKFNADLSLWDVGNVTTLYVRCTLAPDALAPAPPSRRLVLYCLLTATCYMSRYLLCS